MIRVKRNQEIGVEPRLGQIWDFDLFLFLLAQKFKNNFNKHNLHVYFKLSWFRIFKFRCLAIALRHFTCGVWVLIKF